MADIEDELAASWDAAHLAVYGDHLQALGDPRGELVALDLLGGGVDVIARKTELLVAWIGEALLGRILATGAIECGFVELYLDEHARLLADVLASPAGPFVRSLTIRGGAATIASCAAALADAPRPWLARLAIVQLDLARSPPTISRALAERLAKVLPRLAELAVTGHRVFGRLELPQLQRLAVTGHDAISSLGGDGGALLPGVTAVDLAFGAPEAQAGAAVLDQLLPPARFPALVRLDLSRNEPGAFGPHNLGLALDPFAWLRDREISTQLREVLVPSVRTEAQSDALGAALATMPALRRVEQVRRYALRDARFPVPLGVERVVAWPRPWLPPDTLGEAGFSIALHATEPPNLCQGLPLARWLDAHGARLSEHVLAALGHLFGFLDRVPPGEGQRFPAIVLDTALGPLTGGVGLSGWMRLRGQLRRPGVPLPSLSVAIRRL